MIALSAPGVAFAVPSGPGTADGPSAPGTGVAPTAPAIPVTPPSSVGPGAIPDPPSSSGWQINPWGGSGAFVDPIYLRPQYPSVRDPLPLPPPPPMILPEPGMMRAGTWQIEKPTWVTVREMNSFNRWFAYAESRIAQFWISQGLTEGEAQRRAASMIAGGIVGGAAGGAVGFGLGVAPGAAIGVPIGAAIGIPVGGAIGAAILCNGICIALPPLSAPLLTAGYIIGGIAGAGIGAVAGGVVGGAIGGTLVGVPGAILGVAVGTALGEGDPNQDINQVWSTRNGKGEIVPKETVKEFDFNGPKGDKSLPGEAHVNISLKEDDTILVKLGNERWMGATPEQREKFFYKDLNQRIPGLGDVARGAIEDKDGPLRQGIYGLMEDLDRTNPNAQFNRDGALPEGTAPTPIPYGTSPTPIPWEEPNREGVEQQREANVENLAPLPGPAPAPAPTPAPESIPASTPAVAPQPSNPVDTAVKGFQKDVNNFLGGILPPAK